MTMSCAGNKGMVHLLYQILQKEIELLGLNLKFMCVLSKTIFEWNSNNTVKGKEITYVTEMET